MNNDDYIIVGGIDQLISNPMWGNSQKDETDETVWLITGGFGFIGSNLIRELNKDPNNSIIICDNLDDKKFRYIADCENVVDIVPHEKMYEYDFSYVDRVVHLGAISSTKESSGKEIQEKNISFSLDLIEKAIEDCVDMVYASSHSVYGNYQKGDELKENPLNLYAYSKMVVDNFVRKMVQNGDIESKLIGLRFTNIYGPYEFHKVGQESPMLRFYQEALSGRVDRSLKVMSGYAGEGFPGAREFSRDFYHVNDVVKCIVSCFEEETTNGIFDCGSGESHTFEEVAKLVQEWFTKTKGDFTEDLPIEYISFPEELKGKSQPYTKAPYTMRQDNVSFENGVHSYLAWLDENYKRFV